MDSQIDSLILSGLRPHQIMKSLGVTRRRVKIRAVALGCHQFKQGREPDIQKKKIRAARLLEMKRIMTYAEIGTLEGVSRQCIQHWIAEVIPRPPLGIKCSQCNRKTGHRLHRHHNDYATPDDITLLCGKCHKEQDCALKESIRFDRFATEFSGRSSIFKQEAFKAGFARKDVGSFSQRLGIRVHRNTSKVNKYPVDIINWSIPLTILVRIWKFPSITVAYSTRKRSFPATRQEWHASNPSQTKKHSGAIVKEGEKAKSWFGSGGFEAIRKNEQLGGIVGPNPVLHET